MLTNISLFFITFLWYFQYSASKCGGLYLEHFQELCNPTYDSEPSKHNFSWRKQWYTTPSKFRDTIFNILYAQFSKNHNSFFENMKKWKAKKWWVFFSEPLISVAQKEKTLPESGPIFSKCHKPLLDFWKIILLARRGGPKIKSKTWIKVRLNILIQFLDFIFGLPLPAEKISF